MKQKLTKAECREIAERAIERGDLVPPDEDASAEQQQADRREQERDWKRSQRRQHLIDNAVNYVYEMPGVWDRWPEADFIVDGVLYAAWRRKSDKVIRCTRQAAQPGQERSHSENRVNMPREGENAPQGK